MTPRNHHINQELLEVAPQLAAVGTRLPFSVPDGYFDGLVSVLLSKVKTDKANDIPAGYFDQFASQMLQRVRSNEVREELEEVSPFLNSLPKTMPHAIPEGYFETWQPTIQRQKEHQPAKIISLNAPTRWKQWAAAAAILVTIGIGWQFMVNKPGNSPDNVLVSTVAVDTLLTGIDVNSLTNFLEEEQANSEFASLLMVAQQDVETGVAQLSDEELKWYLDNQAVAFPGT